MKPEGHQCAKPRLRSDGSTTLAISSILDVDNTLSVKFSAESGVFDVGITR